MIKKTITYIDYDGVEHTEDYYFHLAKPELVEMRLTHGEDYYDYLQTIVKDKDGAGIMRAFREIISRSVGLRSDDGVQFIRDELFTNRFMNSPAYEELFMSLVTDDKVGLEFAQGVLPSDLAKKAVAARNEPREYSKDELLAMDEAEFDNVAGERKDMDRNMLLIAMQRDEQRFKKISS